jgi:hypothetical protein
MPGPATAITIRCQTGLALKLRSASSWGISSPGISPSIFT